MLNSWYVTGITDGEGCFSVFLNTENRRRMGFVTQYRYWVVTFIIRLRLDDKEILLKLREFFNCGLVHDITIENYNQSAFQVRNRKDLMEKIIPHFEKYPLQAKKQREFLLWKEAVTILYNSDIKKKLIENPASKQQLSDDEKNRLTQIKIELMQRLTNKKKQKAIDSLSKLYGKERLFNNIALSDTSLNV